MDSVSPLFIGIMLNNNGLLLKNGAGAKKTLHVNTASLFDSHIYSHIFPIYQPYFCLSQPVPEDGGQTASDRRAGDEDAGDG